MNKLIQKEQLIQNDWLERVNSEDDGNSISIVNGKIYVKNIHDEIPSEKFNFIKWILSWLR